MTDRRYEDVNNLDTTAADSDIPSDLRDKMTSIAGGTEELTMMTSFAKCGMVSNRDVPQSSPIRMPQTTAGVMMRRVTLNQTCILNVGLSLQGETAS